MILPGLINTHTHAPMVLYRGLADDLALMDWLQKYIFPAEAKTVSPDFVRVGTRLAALEMIESGTTTFADMYYFEDDIAEATREAGLRAVLGQSVIKFPVADAKTPEEALVRAEAFITKWKDDPLVTPAVAPHAPYTLDAATLKAVRELADKTACRSSSIWRKPRRNQDHPGRPSHVADEVPRIARRLERPVARGARRVAGRRGHAILAKRGVGVAHNPESNMKLASGVAAVPKWIAHGIGRPRHRWRRQQQRPRHVRGDAARGDAAQRSRISTRGRCRRSRPSSWPRPARRRGPRPRAIASARPRGRQAGRHHHRDHDGARQTPMFDPISHLVYVTRGDDVRTTIVAGRVLMRDGQVLTLQRADVMRDARAMAERVRHAVKGRPHQPDGAGKKVACRR